MPKIRHVTNDQAIWADGRKIALTDHASNSRNTEGFIAALESIKEILERVYNRHFSGAGQAIQPTLDRNHRVARNNKPALNALKDLRNVIQYHAYKRGVAIATPRSQSVEQAELMAEQIANHPQVREFMIKNPAVL